MATYPPYVPSRGVPVPVATVTAGNPSNGVTLSHLALGAMALAAVWMFTNRPVTPVSPVEPNTPVVVVSGLESVVAASTDKDAVRQLGELYLAMGDIVGRNAPLQARVLRSWFADADTYTLTGTSYIGKVPGFGKAVNDEFESLLGLDDRMLTAAEMASVSVVCKRIAATCGVKGA